jgi:HPt (histidine-containing phosphotransfer) domain-containing protein
VTLFSRRRGGSKRGPPHADPARPAFDLSTLLDIFDGERGAIAGLLEVAIASIRIDVAAAERAAKNNDWTAVLALAHRLKGTSGSIGAGRLIDVCSKIEREVAELAEPTDGVDPALLAELRAAANAVTADIASYSAAAD